MSSLPQVTREVAERVMSEANLSGKGYAEFKLEQIAAENQLIAVLISPNDNVKYDPSTLTAIVMYDMLRRSGDLPEVSEDALRHVQKMLSKRLDKKRKDYTYLNELLARMRRKNPEVAMYVSTSALIAKGPSRPIGVPIETFLTLYLSAVVYRALEIEAARTGSA